MHQCRPAHLLHHQLGLTHPLTYLDLLFREMDRDPFHAKAQEALRKLQVGWVALSHILISLGPHFHLAKRKIVSSIMKVYGAGCHGVKSVNESGVPSGSRSWHPNTV